MFAQITFQLLQKFFASCAIFSALRRIRVNPIEIVTADKKIAGATASLLERIPLTFRHLRRVDNGGCMFFWLATGRVRVAAATGFCAGLFSNLFFRSF